MKVAVLTTSYPRGAGDMAGHFVEAAVEHTRAAGVGVVVVSPGTFPHFGVGYGAGIAQNLRRAPWKAALVPAFMAAYARAARRAAHDADLVHAHWIPSAVAARATGKPYVLQVWGTDVALARRAPRVFRPLLRSARLVIAGSAYLAGEAQALGALEVRIVPPGLEIPAIVAASDEPPHVLYAGRLSEEKGVLELAEATRGLSRVVVGDGPLRAALPDTRGAVSPAEIGGYYERAALVCVPSRREGYGMAAREAMAYGRPVVASAVGGLRDALTDGVDGVLVPPRDPAALRAALERLLGDAGLRARLGSAARQTAEKRFSWPVSTASLLDAYAEALS